MALEEQTQIEGSGADSSSNVEQAVVRAADRWRPLPLEVGWMVSNENVANPIRTQRANPHFFRRRKDISSKKLGQAALVKIFGWARGTEKTGVGRAAVPPIRADLWRIFPGLFSGTAGTSAHSGTA